MTTATETGVTTQVNRIYIKTTAQAVWDAITEPEWTVRYGYGAIQEFDLRPGGTFRAFSSDVMKERGKELGYEIPDLAVDGEVIEADPPRKLVQTWRMLMDPNGAEGFTRLTYEIEEGRGGVSKLTVIHDLAGAPRLALAVAGEMGEEAGGGHSWALNELKTLLETGHTFNA